MYVPPCGGRGQNRCRHPNDWRARFGRPEVASGAKLFIQQHGETVAGRKIELIIRDDAGVPDNGKRLAQELIVKDKVSFLGQARHRPQWPWRRLLQKQRLPRW